MPVAQVIRITERQAMGGPRRPTQTPTACVILPFPRLLAHTLAAMIPGDDDRSAGRGRDPG